MYFSYIQQQQQQHRKHVTTKKIKKYITKMASPTATSNREELARQFDALCEQHAAFLQRSLNNSAPSIVIEQINQWETDTINKIKKVAQDARENVEAQLSEDKKTVQYVFQALRDELKESP